MTFDLNQAGSLGWLWSVFKGPLHVTDKDLDGTLQCNNERGVWSLKHASDKTKRPLQAAWLDVNWVSTALYRHSNGHNVCIELTAPLFDVISCSFDRHLVDTETRSSVWESIILNGVHLRWLKRCQLLSHWCMHYDSKIIYCNIAFSTFVHWLFDN